MSFGNYYFVDDDFQFTILMIQFNKTIFKLSTIKMYGGIYLHNLSCIVAGAGGNSPYYQKLRYRQEIR